MLLIITVKDMIQHINIHFALYLFICALIIGFVLGKAQFEERSIDCTEGVVVERILTTVDTDEENITNTVTQYLIECTKGDIGETFRIQTGKTYPLLGKIKQTWVNNG